MGSPGEVDPVLTKSVPLGWGTEFDLNFHQIPSQEQRLEGNLIT